MSILTKAIGHVATAKTFAMAFWPWLVGAALVGAGVAGYGAFQVTRVFYRGEAAEAREQLAKFEAAIATGAADTQAEVRRLQSEAEAADRARQAAILSAIANGWQQVQAQVRRDNLILREAINAPEYDCLRIAYPADALRLLSRPGGAVPAGDHPGSGAAAAP